MRFIVGETVVKLVRAVVVKSAHTFVPTDPKKPREHRAAQVDMVSVPALVIAIRPQAEPNDPPLLDLAFIDPKRMAVLQTADWRSVFDRLVGVRHESDPLAKSEPQLSRYCVTAFDHDPTALEALQSGAAEAGRRYAASQVSLEAVTLENQKLLDRVRELEAASAKQKAADASLVPPAPAPK